MLLHVFSALVLLSSAIAEKDTNSTLVSDLRAEITSLRSELNALKTSFRSDLRNLSLYATAIRTLEDHDDSVTALAISQNHGAEIVFSASVDQTVKINNAFSGREIEIKKEITGNITSLLAIENSIHLVGGCSAKGYQIKVWNYETGKVVKTLQGHKGNVNALVVTSGGHLLSGSSDNTIKMWNLKQTTRDNSKAIKTLSGHTGPVLALVINKEGQLVSGSADGTIRVWDLEGGIELKKIAAHNMSVNALALNASNDRIFSASSDKTIKVWNLKESEISAQTLTGHDLSVTSLAIRADGQLVSGSLDTTIKVWDLNSGTCVRTLTGHKGRINALIAGYSGQVISASSDGTVKIWMKDFFEN